MPMWATWLASLLLQKAKLSVPPMQNNLLYSVLCMAFSAGRREHAAPCMCLHALAACACCLPFALPYT